MFRKSLILLLMLSFSTVLFAQQEKAVTGEFVYCAPLNVSREQARAIAIDRARMQALADEFGTLIEAYNAAVMKNRNDTSTMEYFTLGESTVKGEWLYDTQDPVIEERLEDGLLTVKARVWGMAREIVPTSIDGQVWRLRDSIAQSDAIDKGHARKWHTFVTLNAACSMLEQYSFGVSVGQVARFGWFVSVMSNGNLSGFHYKGDCDREGYLDGGYLMLYTGEVSKTRLSVMAGGLMRIAGRLYARIGLGYGVRTLRWRTVDGEWYRNTAYSHRGIDLSAGLQLHLGRFAASVEAVTTQFQSMEAKVGVGIVF